MIASQMRGGYYTPIAEARGTISPSQALPNLDRIGFTMTEGPFCFGD